MRLTWRSCAKSRSALNNQANCVEASAEGVSAPE